MTPASMRIATPCSEDLDAMQKTERGVFCDKCQHDVVDLRRTPKKKALAVLAQLRSEAAEAGSGRVCVRVRVRPDRTPVFAPDPPSAFARLAAPIALATSLAACTSSARTEPATPVAMVDHDGTTGGTNDNARVVTSTVTVVVPNHSQTPPTDVLVIEPVTDMAGGMAFSP